MLDNRRRVQAAADGAALAAGSDLYANYGTNQGYDNAGKNSRVRARLRGSSGTARTQRPVDGPCQYVPSSTVTSKASCRAASYTAQAGFAEAIVTYNQPRGFSAHLRLRSPPRESARAVARGTLSPASSAGLILLNPTASKALMPVGNGTLSITNGGVIVDSNDSKAIFINGNGAITYYINVTGNVFGNSGNITTSPGTLTTGVAAITDPLASIPEPSSSSLTAGSSSSVANPGGKKAGSTWTLSPGIYGTGGATMPSFGSNDTIIFQQASAGNSGIYYLASVRIQLDGKALQMASGSRRPHVLQPGTTNSDSFNLSVESSNSTTSTLSPLTSGIYQGISYFQNRLGTQSVSLAGNGLDTFTISGTYYAVGASLTLTGNGNATFGSQVIVDQMKLAGNGNIGISYNSNSVAQLRSIALVE